MVEKKLMEHDLKVVMIFGIKIKNYNVAPYNVFLQIYPGDSTLVLCCRVTKVNHLYLIMLAVVHIMAVLDDKRLMLFAFQNIVKIKRR